MTLAHAVLLSLEELNIHGLINFSESVHIHGTVASVSVAVFINNIVVHVLFLVDFLVVRLISIGKLIRVLLVVRVGVRMDLGVKLDVTVDVNNMVFTILFVFKFSVIVFVSVAKLIAELGVTGFWSILLVHKS